MVIQSEKEELIEELGIHFETLHVLPPLAARIYAILLLDAMKGMTFEELNEMTCSSKSSVSTSINFLLQTEMIDYFTLPGDRKRYFRKKPIQHNLQCRLNKYVSLIDKEVVLFEKTRTYMEENNKAHTETYKPYLDVYQEYLKETQKLMQNTLHKLETANSNLN